MALGYRHFSFQERMVIESQLTLGSARSSVWREIRRDGWLKRPPHLRIAGGYRALLADRRARPLAARPQVPCRLVAGSRLWEIVLGHLRRRLSPEQISRTLAGMADPVRLSHQALYDALYAMPRGDLRTRVLDLLRRRHKARRTRTGARTGRSKSIPAMTLIDQRPDEVQQRLVPGHWEATSFSAIATAPRSERGSSGRLSSWPS